LDKNQVPEKVIESKSDVVVFLGAGDIYKITEEVDFSNKMFLKCWCFVKNAFNEKSKKKKAPRVDRC
ncbi:MAG: hypothetical protein VXZ27_13790, partial [SAR324 cluster bacterium]|nr:hypothetical protein [SAR324 cluster bacterium]